MTIYGTSIMMVDYPYENEECKEDDPVTLCDGCKDNKAREHAQGFRDTFD